VTHPPDLSSACRRLLRVGGPLREVHPAHAETTVLLYSGPDAGTASHIAASWPGFEPFTRHELYRSGTYRCEIVLDDTAPYSASRKAPLRFHSDMALVQEPPQISSIRCLVPDEGPPGSATNIFIHVADIVQRLRDSDRQDILRMLSADRPVQLMDGTVVVAPMLANPLGSAPLRIFDRVGWQMAGYERALLEELLNLCDEWFDLQVRVRLDAQDAAIFSNWHFLHSRSTCASTTRVTEISLGFLRQR